jgi:uncharacterized protein (TIGR02679 family)
VTEVDPQRIARILGDPDLAWLVDRMVARLIRGIPLNSTVVLDTPSPAQRRAVAKLLGRPPRSGGSVTVSLPAVTAVLRHAGVAPDLAVAVEALRGGRVTPRSQIRARKEAERAAALEAARRSRYAGEDWFTRWIDALAADGTLTRLLRTVRGDLLAHAAAVLDVLPAEDVPLPVLAQRAVGDTKALAGTPLAGLVLRAVEEWTGLRSTSRRDLWKSVGVVVDDLASQVLVLNVPATGGPLGRWLTEAASLGMPLRVTLQQLTAVPVTLELAGLWVCENPAVLRVAAADLGAACPPLLCTEGVPSLACHRLASAASRSGAIIRWRGDLDWTGLRTTADAVSRHGAAPWRMTTREYRDGLAASPGVPLKGPPASSPWEPALADAMRVHGRAVMEEQSLPVLLADLAAAGAA